MILTRESTTTTQWRACFLVYMPVGLLRTETLCQLPLINVLSYSLRNRSIDWLNNPKPRCLSILISRKLRTKQASVEHSPLAHTNRYSDFLRGLDQIFVYTGISAAIRHCPESSIQTSLHSIGINKPFSLPRSTPAYPHRLPLGKRRRSKSHRPDRPQRPAHQNQVLSLDPQTTCMRR